MAGKRHVRRQSYGKIMPISSLLNNLIGGNLSVLSSDERELRSLVQPNNTTSPLPSPLSPVHSTFNPLALNNSTNNRVNERSDSSDSSDKNASKSTLNFIKHESMEQEATARDDGINEVPAIDIDVDKAFLKCVNYRHSLTGGIEPLDIPPNANEDPEDDIDRVLITTDDDDDDVNEAPASCMICTNKAPINHSLMNVLCKKLCDDSCNTSTKTCQSNGNDDAGSITTARSDASTIECVDEPFREIDGNAESVTSVKRSSNSSRQEFLASMLEPDQNDESEHEKIAKQQDQSGDDCDLKSDGSQVAPLTVENLEQFNNDYFREKLSIAEALANASMMSTPAARRLQARKIEMSLNTPDFVYDPENAEYIPPKELLMYLVR